jgi:histidinol dehydrogenase
MSMQRQIDPTRDQLTAFLARPMSDSHAVETVVQSILDRVRAEGDPALFGYERQFDHARLSSFEVTPKEIDLAVGSIEAELKTAIERAARNIVRFHSAQIPRDEMVETEPGVRCWRKSVPIRKVGLYIPGGSAPLFSTVLMLAIPARLAGCQEITLATPPRADGTVHPAVLFAALAAGGVTRILKLGGAQAIAALAYGTQSIAKVDKIFGPGNRYVTAAKQLVASRTCAIDLPAGPSEVMVLADMASDPAFCAADLLSQAEHGPDSQTVLVVLAEDLTQGEAFVDQVERCIEEQIAGSDRTAMITGSLSHSRAVVVSTEDRMVAVANQYGPEHLIISTDDPQRIADRIDNAGSLFLGRWSPESAGDYASGTNHTLPTAGWSASFSGVSLESYMKKMTFQQLSYEALESLGPTIITMAEAESLNAHANAVALRLAAGRKEHLR